MLAAHVYDESRRNRVLYSCVDNHVGVTYDELWFSHPTPGTFKIHMNP
jgi:hypothetical protein